MERENDRRTRATERRSNHTFQEQKQSCQRTFHTLSVQTITEMCFTELVRIQLRGYN